MVFSSSVGSVPLLVPLICGCGCLNFVERVTQSLRRMIEYANKDTHERTLPLGMIITPEDIYRYFILVDANETARFLKRSRIMRSKRF